MMEEVKQFPKGEGAQAAAAVPEISVEDKLTAKTLEVNALAASVRVRDMMNEMSQHQRALTAFIDTLFEKHGLSNVDYVLDLQSTPIKFVKRG